MASTPGGASRRRGAVAVALALANEMPRLSRGRLPRVAFSGLAGEWGAAPRGARASGRAALLREKA
eukprot:9276009-Pyramimonas_sp.AAC.1